MLLTRWLQSLSGFESRRRGREQRRNRDSFRLRLEKLERRLLLTAPDTIASTIAESLDSLAFEENRGQAQKAIDFIGRGLDYEVSISAGETAILLVDPALESLEAERRQSVVRIAWRDGNRDAQPTGLDRLPGSVNYLLGADPSAWHTDVARFARVSYDDVYRGIDLEYYASGGRLEFDWIVEPGADPDAIAMALSGADAITLDPEGHLRLETAAGGFIQERPRIYQDVAGARHEVEGRYVEREPGVYGFLIEEYDTALPLVIDPLLGYSTYLGGGPTPGTSRTGNDYGNDIAVDAAGNAYVTGTTSALDFNTTRNGLFPELPDLTPFNRPVAFVTKFDPTGAFVYSTYLGIENVDPRRVIKLHGATIAVDSDGSAYVAGDIIDYVLHPTANITIAKNTDGIDAFVAKLSPDGDALKYFTTFHGGSGTARPPISRDDLSAAIAIDERGNAYVTGSSYRVTVSSDMGGRSTTMDAFIAQIDPGGSVDFAAYLGGSDTDYAEDIALRADGSVFVVGTTFSDDFSGSMLDDFAFGPAGGSDAFLTQYFFDPAGGDPEILLSSYLGGRQDDWGHAVATDSAGDVYVAGATFSRDVNFFVIGFPPDDPSLQPRHAGMTDNTDGFVAQITPVDPLARGRATLHYFTYLGGTSGEGILGIAVDSSLTVHVAGVTASADFPTHDAAATLRGGLDGFVAAISADGRRLVYSTPIGSTNWDYVRALALDPGGLVHVVGSTTDSTLRPPNDAEDFFRNLVRVGASFPVFNAVQDVFGGGEVPVDAQIVSAVSGFGLPQDAFVVKFIGTGISAGRFIKGAPRENIHDFVGTFTSPRLNAEADDFEVTVEWGDGTQSTITTGIVKKIFENTSFFFVPAIHAYQEADAYPIVLHVTDRKANVPDEVSGRNLFDPEPTRNVSRLGGQHVDASAAVDPTSDRVVVVGTDETGIVDGGFFAAFSEDGGASWATRRIADGNDGLPLGSGPASVAFDRAGRVFLAYSDHNNGTIHLAFSYDHGQTFSSLAQGNTGRNPVLAVGTAPLRPGETPSLLSSVWVAYEPDSGGAIEVFGARVHGIPGGNPSLNVTLSPVAPVPGSAGGRHPDVAVGPKGEMLVTWESSGPLRAVVNSSVDPDGDGSEPFGATHQVVETRMDSALIPAMGAAPEITRPFAHVAWDSSGGLHHGRMYVVYANLQVENDLLFADRQDIFVVHSDDDGRTWSEPTRVNEDDGPAATNRFLPSLAVDPANGNVAVGWHDTRGSGGTGSRFFVATSNDGGQTFRGDVTASEGFSDATAPELNAQGAAFGYGRGGSIVFANSGAFFAASPDNSDSLLGNPERPQFELAIARFGLADVRAEYVTIFPRPFSAAEGVPFSGVVARFFHPDAARRNDEFEVVIHWGDGAFDIVTPTQLSSPGDAESAFDVRGTHTYAEAGAYLVWVTVFDTVTGLTSLPTENVSRSPDTQTEVAVAVDPSDFRRRFVTSVNEGLFGEFVNNSTTGFWKNPHVVGTGNDGYLPSAGDPDAAFDEFGNLFFVYMLLADTREVVVLASPDAGDSFVFLDSLPGLPAGTSANIDYPKIAAGPGPGGEGGQVVLMYEYNIPTGTQGIAYASAVVHGRIDDRSDVDSFELVEVIPDAAAGGGDGKIRNFGDVAIGPDGQVLVVYNSNALSGGILVHLDPDGAGPLPIGPPSVAAETHLVGRVNGLFPAQFERGIIVQGNLAWDRSPGPHHGRVYLSYLDTPVLNSPDSDVYLVFSDDDGRTWSGGFLFTLDLELVDALTESTIANEPTAKILDAFADHDIQLLPDSPVEEIDPGEAWRITNGFEDRYIVRLNAETNRLDVHRERVRVNSTERDGSSQLFPSLDVDQQTGNLVVGWMSAFQDPGNDELQFRVAVSSNGGLTFSEPRVTSYGWSNAARPEMGQWSRDHQFLEYTGVSVVDGLVVAAWAENSPELPHNPRTSHLEIAAGMVAIAQVSAAPLIASATHFEGIEGMVLADQEVATFHDTNLSTTARDYSAQIDWGDNTAPTDGVIQADGGGFSVSGSHKYKELGEYFTRVTIRGPGTTAIVGGVANIEDALLEVFGAERRVIEDTAFTETVAVFFDLNTGSDVGDFTATIDWGDDSAAEPGVVEFRGPSFGQNRFAVVGTHAYMEAGFFDVTVTVTHNGVAHVVDSVFDSGGPSIAVDAASIAEFGALEGVLTAPIVLAEFEVQGAIDQLASLYWAEIDWDDGLTDVVTNVVPIAGTTFQIVASHVFRESGTLFPVVTLHDNTGRSAIAILSANVARDLTTDVNPIGTGPIFNPVTNSYHAGITVLNTSLTSFTGPFHIVLTGLSAGLDIAGTPSGFTFPGDPYYDVDQGLLAPGASLPPVALEFIKPDGVDITYTAKVYAGVASFLLAQALFADAAPEIVVAQAPITAVEGKPVNAVIATFTDADPNPSGEYTATIDWGDGTTSLGTVVAASGTFEVRAQHTYQRYDEYPVSVRVSDIDGNSSAATSTSASVSPGGFVDYAITVDTSSLAGRSGSVALQFNPGVVFRADEASAVVRDVTVAGGALHGVTLREGTVGGDLTGIVEFANGAALTRLVQALDFGASLTFDVRLSGDAISDPSPFGSFASTLALQLLNDAGVPLLSTDPSAALFTLDVLPGGATRFEARHPTATASAVALAVVADAPIVATAVVFDALEGATFTEIVATFEDENSFGTADEFSTTIDWGDGLSSPGVVGGDAVSGFTVAGTHAYETVGQYAVTVEVISAGGSSSTAAPEIENAGIQGTRVYLTQPLMPRLQMSIDIASVTTADFNGDGALDLAATNRGNNPLDPSTVGILFNDGTGDYRPAVIYPTGDVEPVSIVSGDFNGDTRPDIAVTIRGRFVAAGDYTNSAVVILMNAGNGVFGAPVRYAASDGPVAIVTADLDRDGDLDLVVGSEDVADRLDVFLGAGDGSFAPLASRTILGAGPLSDLAASDFDEDGRIDVALSHRQQSGVVRLLFGAGNGTFVRESFVSTNPMPSSVTVDDLNRDGHGDLVVTGNTPTGTVSVFRGVGNGTFGSPLETVADVAPANSHTGDFNADGIPDLAVIGSRVTSPTNHIPFFTDGVTILPGVGDGTFASPLSFVRDLSGIPTLAIGDFTMDGALDLVVASHQVGVRVLPGRGDGSFVDVDRFSGTWNPRFVATGDFDLDGVPDLVTTSTSDLPGSVRDDGALSVLRGIGTGGFSPPVHIAAGAHPAAVVPIDLNGDGRLDLVVANAGGTLTDREGGVSVLLGRAGGDFDAAVHYEAGWVPSALVVRDLDGDGALDVATANASSHDVSVLMGNGDGTLRAARHFRAGQIPRDIDAGDFNGDGRLDLAVLNQAGTVPQRGSVAILPSDGAGGFAAPIETPTRLYSWSLDAADLDGDGKLDLVVANEGDFQTVPNGGVLVLGGNGNGTFAERQFLTRGITGTSLRAPSAVVLADFNGNGVRDLAVGYQDFGIVDVFTGLANGTFNPTPAALGPSISWAVASNLVATDLNRDGRLDLIHAAYQPEITGDDTDFVAVRLGNGDGTFQPRVHHHLDQNISMFDTESGDFDSDGTPDLVVTSSFMSGALMSGAVGRLFFGRADGTLSPVKYVALPSAARYLGVDDFNEDGRPDIVTSVASLTEPGVYVVLNTGGGTFGGPTGTAVPRQNVNHLATGDFNGDGHIDVVVNYRTNTGASNTLAVLLGNGEGGLTLQASVPALGGMQVPNALAVGDVNEDGHLDVIHLGADVWVHLGNGDGALQTARALGLGFGFSALGITVDDFDLDGFLDFAVALKSGVTPDLVRIFRGRGDGTFAAGASYETGYFTANAAGIETGDFNADGWADIAVTGSNGAAHSVIVLYGNGDGTFAGPEVFETGTFSDVNRPGLAVLDLNRDGASDLAIPDANHTAVLLGAGGQGVEVRNAPITAAGVEIHPVAGVAFTAVVATFTDVNTFAVPADYTVTVEWGDGATSTGVVAGVGSGFEVSASHTYVAAGNRTVTITIIDDVGGTASASSLAEVRATGLAPSASPVSVTATEDAPFTGPVATFTDSDPGGGPRDFRATIHWGDSATTTGVITGTAANGFTIAGTHTWTLPGSYLVDVTIVDIDGSMVMVASPVSVVPVNDAPRFNSTPVTSAVEGAGYAYVVTASDEDHPPAALRFRTLARPAWLTLFDHGDGTATLSGTPLNAEVGAHTVTLEVADAGGATEIQSFTVAVANTNEAPTIAPQAFAVDENSAASTLVGAVSALDIDAGDTLTYCIAGGSGGAAFVIDAATGVLSVAVGAVLDAEATPTFTVIVEATDAAGAPGQGSVTIQLLNVNEAPSITHPATATVFEDSPLVFSAGGGNPITLSDPDAGSGLIRAVLSVDDGTVTLTGMDGLLVASGANGTPTVGVIGRLVDINAALDGLVVEPPANFAGGLVLHILVNDLGSSGSGRALAAETDVSITVALVNDPPAFVAPSRVTLFEDADPLAISIRGVSAGPANEAGQNVTLTAVSSNPALLPHPTVNGNDQLRQLILAPAANRSGVAIVTITAHDDGGTANGGDDTTVATLTLTILSVDDLPAAGGDMYTIEEDGVLDVPAPGVLANDLDGDGGPLVSVLVEAPTHGELTVALDGSFRYVPMGNFTGNDSFVYAANDAAGVSALATVQLTVTPRNDDPLAFADAYEMEQGSTLVVAAAGLLSNDIDSDGDGLSALLETSPIAEMFELRADGSFTVMPVADFSGTLTFSYRAGDGTSTSAPAVVSIRVHRLTATPTVVISESDGSTEVVEGGSTDRYMVVLSERPRRDVVVEILPGAAVAAFDATRAERRILVFTPDDWDVPQPVVVRAVDDFVDVGASFDTSIAHRVTSSDARYHASAVAPIDVTVIDDDSAGIVVSGAALSTSESHASGHFLLRLTSQPRSDVTLTVRSSDPTEGEVLVESFTFSPASWRTPWLVEVRGVDDDFVDGSIAYTVMIEPAESGDSLYDGVDPRDVAAVNADDGETLRVIAFTPTPSGFVATFNRAIDDGVLNLYDARDLFGPPDVSLTRGTTTVQGSLVVDAPRRTVTFIATDGLLGAEPCEVTLRSAANGFHGANGPFDLLDGDDNGLSGGNFTAVFEPPLTRNDSLESSGELIGSAPFDGDPVLAVPLALARIPHVTRGPGQDVDVPTSAPGITVILTGAAGTTTLALTFRYDPELLTVTGLALPAGLTGSVDIDLTEIGMARATIVFDEPLAGDDVHVASILSSVPENAPYGARQILAIEADLDGGRGAVLAGTALHVVAYPGDATGNFGYSALDAQRVLRVSAGRDTGFAAYRLTDPVIVADVSGDGELNLLDAALIFDELIGLDRAEIPLLPGLLDPTSVAGRAMFVNLPRDISVRPGDTLTIPVRVDDALDLESVDLELAWNTAVLEITAVRTATLTEAGSSAAAIDGTTGSLDLALALIDPLGPGGGALFEVDIRIRSDAPLGPTDLDLEHVSLNEDGFVLTPAPALGADPTDGRITVRFDDNIAPSNLVISVLPSTINEHSTAILSGNFSDPDSLDTHTVVITWGDGSPNTTLNLAAGVLSIPNTAHTFLDNRAANAPYAISVLVTDEDGAAVSGGTAVVVNNVAPSALAVSVTSATHNHGEPLTLSGEFFDPGTLDTHTVQINWGDTTTQTVSLAAGVLNFNSISHTYLAAGMANGTVTVVDKDGLSTSQSFAVTVRRSIYVLEPSSCGALTLSGSAEVNVPGKVVVNSSCSTSALAASGNARVTASDIQVVGGAQATGNARFSPTPTTHVAVIPDPLAALPVPSPGSSRGAINCAGHSTLTIQPGVYTQIHASGNCSLVLDSGIYIIAGGGFNVTGNAAVYGSVGGILLYNANSNYPQSGGSFGGINLSGNGAFSLDPLASGPYSGTLVFQPATNTRALSLSGNSTLGGMHGTIYAPSAQLSLSGNGTLQASLIVGKLKVSGNAASQLVTADTTTTRSAFDESQTIAVDGGELTQGTRWVAIDQDGGKLSAEQLERIEDGIATINAKLGPYGVTLVAADAAHLEAADIRIIVSSTSPCGGRVERVLGCTTAQGEITLLDGWAWYTGADRTNVPPQQYDFQAIVTHELGHAVGVDHSSDPASVMFSQLTTGMAYREFTEHDLSPLVDIRIRQHPHTGGELPATTSGVELIINWLTAPLVDPDRYGRREVYDTMFSPEFIRVSRSSRRIEDLNIRSARSRHDVSPMDESQNVSVGKKAVSLLNDVGLHPYDSDTPGDPSSRQDLVTMEILDRALLAVIDEWSESTSSNARWNGGD